MTPVSTTLVVNLELGIFPRIFEKIKTVLMGYSGAGGKLIHEKKQKQKISRHCPLKGREGTSTPQALITSEFYCLVVSPCIAPEHSWALAEKSVIGSSRPSDVDSGKYN